MADSIQEQEKFRKAEVVKIGQIFDLFDPTHTESLFLYTPEGTKTTHMSSVILKSDLLPDWKISIRSNQNNSRRGSVIAPFNPDVGYQITNDDYDPQKRLEKLRSQQEELTKDVDPTKAPHILMIDTQEDENVKAGIATKNGYILHFKPEFIPTIARLRVQLFFNFENRSFSCQGSPYLASLRKGLLWFRNFTPLDHGPLPKTEIPKTEEYGLLSIYFQENGRFLPEGYGIQLPDDLEKLQTIRAKFVLAEESKEEDEVFDKKEDAAHAADMLKDLLEGKPQKRD